MFTRRFAIISAALVLSVLTGCNSQAIDDNIINDRDTIKSEMGPDGEFIYLRVPSQGFLNDAIVGGLIATSGPSALAQQVSEIMSTGQNKPIRLAITGYSKDKTRDTILSALKLNEGKSLKQMKLMYIGFPECREKIQSAVEKVDGKFYFRSFIKEVK